MMRIGNPITLLPETGKADDGLWPVFGSVPPDADAPRRNAEILLMGTQRFAAVHIWRFQLLPRPWTIAVAASCD